MSCHHLEPQVLNIPPPDPKSFKVFIIPNLGEKARSWPPLRQVEIDQRFWESLDKPQKSALLSHELAHLEPGPARRDDGGQPCENCADKRGGAIMAGWGYSQRETMKAAQSIINTRPRAAYSYAEGWKSYRGGLRSCLDLWLRCFPLPAFQPIPPPLPLIL